MAGAGQLCRGRAAGVVAADLYLALGTILRDWMLLTIHALCSTLRLYEWHCEAARGQIGIETEKGS